MFAGGDDLSGEQISIAREFVDLLVEEKFEQAAEYFDGNMRAGLPIEKLSQLWNSLYNQMGGFKSQLGVRTAIISEYDVVFITCEFDNGTLDIKVVLNSAGQVAGLFFLPPENQAEYTAPEYVDDAKFVEQDITIGEDKWRLDGKLTIPKQSEKFPVVILVHGSGPQDMDETLGPNKPFRDIAHGLASKGIATLRYNKRTYQYGSKMTEIKGQITVYEETIQDVLNAVQILSKDSRITDIFILGHSLGGMLIPRIATHKPKVTGYIIMAGNTRPLEDMIIEQMRYIYLLDGELSEQEKQQLRILDRQVSLVKSDTLTEDVPADSLPLGVPAKYWLDLRNYKPAETAKSINEPIMIAQGGRDYQVTSEDFNIWKSALSGKDNVEFKYYPQLNHLFFTGEGMATPEEYQQPGNVNSKFIQDISRWIKENSK